MKLPVVNVGSNKRPTYLPSHLLKVIKGQISKLKLNPEHTRAMIKFAVRDPVRNAQSIKNSGFNTLGFMEGNQELVALPSLNVLYDAYELTETGMLWSSCGAEYDHTLWPYLTASTTLIPR